MLLSTEAKFVNKRAVRVMANFAYMLRNRSHKRTRATAASEDECFNCHKIGSFG